MNLHAFPCKNGGYAKFTQDRIVAEDALQYTKISFVSRLQMELQKQLHLNEMLRSSLPELVY